ncbi:MAG: phosphohydrolase [Clostridia bacterium]|nr:phosphohydrolase [Clostridia bacterium]
MHKSEIIEREFVRLVRGIIRSEAFQQMKCYRHHLRGSVYDHSVKVAYLCYRHYKRCRMTGDLMTLLRGALLHDYYLYDLHSERRKHRFHWFFHPRYALDNARRDYPSLNDTERDMISRHMFPLTLRPPATKEGWLVSFYDKVAAVSDCFKIPRRQRHRMTKHKKI